MKAIKKYFSNPINWFILVICGLLETAIFKALPAWDFSFDMWCWVFAFGVVTAGFIASIVISK